MYHHGKYCDFPVMGLLKREWLAFYFTRSAGTPQDEFENRLRHIIQWLKAINSKIITYDDIHLL